MEKLKNEINLIAWELIRSDEFSLIMISLIIFVMLIQLNELQKNKKKKNKKENKTKQKCMTGE